MKTLAIILYITLSVNTFAQIEILPDRPYNPNSPYQPPSVACHRFPILTANTFFSIGASGNETLNFTPSGTNNVGIGTRTRVEGSGSSASSSYYNCFPFYFNEAKLHIRHFGTLSANGSGYWGYPGLIPYSEGPQLLLEQATGGLPTDDYFSRIKFRSSATEYLGHMNYYRRSSTHWLIKASNYAYNYPHNSNQPSYETEEFIINHSLGGEAFHIFGNADIRHNEYTMLGNNAPNIKMAYITGTIPSSGFAQIPHNIADPSKIISITGLAEISATNLIPASYTLNPGNLYNLDINGSNVIVTVGTSSQSSQITGKPVRILITYIK